MLIQQVSQIFSLEKDKCLNINRVYLMVSLYIIHSTNVYLVSTIYPRQDAEDTFSRKRTTSNIIHIYIYSLVI